MRAALRVDKAAAPPYTLPMSDVSPQPQVKLKPFFGIRPGVWLFCLYVSVFLAAAFLFLVLPGIRNPGSVLQVRTEPRGAAVTVDGVYRGTSPCRFFVPRGAHRVETGIPGFETARVNLDVRGRVFASAFFPRVLNVETRLEASDPAGILREAAAEFAAWSFAGEPLDAWQIPQALSEGAYRAASSPAGPETTREFGAIIAGSAGYLQTRAALRDWLRARFLAENGGAPPSPASLVRFAGSLARDAARPGTAFWLADLLEGAAAADLAGSAWYLEAAENSAGTGGASAVPRGGDTGRNFSFAGLEFVYVSSGTLEGGAGFPWSREIKGFWISRTEVTEAAWNAFVAENPAWAAGGREELERQGLVSGAYLETYPPPPGTGAIGVQGISWHAAKAWCAWAGEADRIAALRLELRLPTENEWEYAARLSREGAGPVLENILGGLWEWCEDGYIPLDFLVPPGAETIISPERNLRGGAWINPPGTAGAGTRASLAPDTCSPFTGFRPVIAERLP